MMITPEEANSAVIDEFGQLLGSLLPFFMLIMYIPIIYNLIFIMVDEKESKVKESMRIMGMTDLPYWLSFFVYYLTIITVSNTFAWAILCINVIQYSSKGYIWLFFWLYGISVFGQVVTI